MSRRPLRIIALAGLLIAGSGLAFAIGTTSASADTRICDQYGTTTIGGKYIVMNNRWGSSATQCINVTSTGFSIVQQDGTGNLSGAPVSYPAIYVGCHYSNCSPGTNLPMQISRISSAQTSVTLSYPGSGTYDAAYDIWLNADTNVSGVQDTEIMIWLNHTGSIQPIGSSTGTFSAAGRSWTVWTGSNGSNNVVSYVSSGITSFNTDAMAFIRDAITRGSGYGNTSWYLTSMQMGFEPWIGGVGLAVNNFSATINGGGNPTGGPTTGAPSRTPSRTPTGGPTGAPGTCSASYSTNNSWSGGFQGNVTVKNNGSSSLSGWTVKWTNPNGVTIGQVWNGVLSTSGSSVSVKNEAYNGSIAGNGSTTFGFIGSGSAPSSLSLTCTSP